MGIKTFTRRTALVLGTAALAATPALAKDDVELVKCEGSYGSIAVVDGDTQGWTKFGLSSPRELVHALANESGCFTPVNAASGQQADFLLNVIAGDKEEVDQGIAIAKTAATEGLLRSGAASTILSKVPMGGALLGAFGGFGGKKKTVAAGIRVISPANGMTLVSGSGEVKKSSLSFRRVPTGTWAYGVQQATGASGYTSDKNGRMLTEAFVLAFNNVVSQAGALTAATGAAAATPTATITTTYTVAADSTLWQGANTLSGEVRALRAGTELTPTGKKDGLFVEVTDNYGNTGWVSVEDLQ